MDIILFNFCSSPLIHGWYYFHVTFEDVMAQRVNKLTKFTQMVSHRTCLWILVFCPQILCQLKYVTVNNLGQKVNLKGIVFKTAFTSETDCNFGGFPKAPSVIYVLSFYTYGYGLL